MERLTERFDGWVMRKGCHGPCKTCTEAECADIYPMIDRLAAYEDTGLEPEDIEALRDREQGLAELLVNVSCGCAVPYTRLEELSQAEKDGRLVVLPCKIGDTIFMAVGRYGITGFEEDRCDGFFINREGILQIKAQCYSGNHATYGFPGETVFLTHEEAEAALKKREEADSENEKVDQRPADPRRSAEDERGAGVGGRIRQRNKVPLGHCSRQLHF